VGSEFFNSILISLLNKTEEKILISGMRINLWYCSEMKQWRWTLVDNSRPIVNQESGQQPHLRDAMNDVANTVEYMLECKQSE
jgi:hypothetical protein